MAKGHPAASLDFLVRGLKQQGSGDQSAWITLSEYRTTHQRQIPDPPGRVNSSFKPIIATEISSFR